MKYQAQAIALTSAFECAIFGVFEDAPFSPSLQQLDELTGGYLSQLQNAGDLNAKIGQATLLHQLPNIAGKRVLILGCGKAQKLNVRAYKQVIARLWQSLKDLKVKEVVSFLGENAIVERDLYWHTRFTLETLEHSRYQFSEYKTTPAPEIALERFIFNGTDAAIERAINHAQAISLGVKAARDLANQPPNVCNPAYLAAQAKALAASSPKLSLEVIDEAQMQALGMNAYLAVSRGSQNEALMSVIKFTNAPDPQSAPIVLVGKGLTFDAGGISLKPAADMDEMKYDMGGAATVFGVMNALVALDLPLNVIGVLAGCENLPDGNAYRPGDILRTMNGLTVEVLNTDAEGRLVLCDALTYVERFAPQAVIDIATLTGACVVALGQHNSGLLTEDESLNAALQQAAAESADKAWRLPLGEEYQEQLKSPFADLANIGGRWGGASTAGAFLANFTKNYPWAHLDIAGTAWLQGANKGATGRPVSLLVQYLLNQ